MSVFVDTGAWFAYFVRRDPDHISSRNWLSTNESPLITSDYILDELFTLLKTRESHVVAVAAKSHLMILPMPGPSLFNLAIRDGLLQIAPAR
jgi:predicted nucleic acid-binding protein